MRPTLLNRRKMPRMSNTGGGLRGGQVPLSKKEQTYGNNKAQWFLFNK